jgi:hypothetical protein
VRSLTAGSTWGNIESNGFGHGSGCNRSDLSCSVEGLLPKKVSTRRQGDCCLLAVPGNYGELCSSRVNEENGICRTTLRLEHFLRLVANQLSSGA